MGYSNGQLESEGKGGKVEKVKKEILGFLALVLM